jgi:quinol monooxygenase YgiN
MPEPNKAVANPGVVMSTPVVLSVTFVPLEGARDAVVAALSVAIGEVHEESGCELYALHDGPDGNLVLLEKWSSEEELAAHAAGERVGRLDESLVGLLVTAPEITKLAPLPAGTEMQGQL